MVVLTKTIVLALVGALVVIGVVVVVTVPAVLLTKGDEPGPTSSSSCALCDYVHRDDGFYSYLNMSTVNRSALVDSLPVTTIIINMTSQKWKDENWTTRPIWWHYVVINIPHVLNIPDHAYLHIGGRSNDNSSLSLSSNELQATANMAAILGIVTAIVYHVPNQPLVYTMDPSRKGRYEDDSISWTWGYFLDQTRDHPPADPEVVLRMPMCKSVVRAMDTVQRVTNVDLQRGNITKFMIAGESKRGWTTWLTGAVDERIVAMAPIVLSCLNLIEVMEHYYQSFGGWSYNFYDYWEKNFTGRIHEPEMSKLVELVDPYSYRSRMTMPKLIISAASDEFFLLDDSHYFLRDLPGESHFWLLENSGHSVRSSPSGSDLWLVLGSFYLAVIKGNPRPTFKYELNTSPYRNGTASITVYNITHDFSNMTVWSAHSVVTNRRDWRLSIVGDSNLNINKTGITWNPEPVNTTSDGRYYVEYEAPDEGFLAFFIKIEFPGFPDTEQTKLIMSTEAVVVPDYFPYTACNGQMCQGILV